MTRFPERLVLSSGEMTVELLPEWGTKMISLRTDGDGYEFMAPAPLGPHVPDAAVFAPADAYGFDEMFPGVYPQSYPAPPWKDVTLADHGDLWYRAWNGGGGGTEADLWIENDRVGWRFGKRLKFVDSRTLETTYRVDNRSAHPLYWLYCAHMLCPFHDGIELDLPESRYRRLETFGHQLPEECGGDADFLRRSEAFPAHSAAYYVSDAVGAAACAFIDRPARKALRLGWSPPVNYLSIWYNKAAWTPEVPLTHVGLEPTTAGNQDLAEWVKTGLAVPLGPGAHASWTLTVSLFDLA